MIFKNESELKILFHNVIDVSLVEQMANNVRADNSQTKSIVEHIAKERQMVLWILIVTQMM